LLIANYSLLIGGRLCRCQADKGFDQADKGFDQADQGFDQANQGFDQADKGQLGISNGRCLGGRFWLKAVVTDD
jgi:hypothetical protein